MKIYAELTENIWNRKNCGIKSLQVNKLFHIHFGYPGFNTRDSLTLIKYFDMYIGVPSVLLDTDKKRRKLYGKAGCFRLTGYGFEYRVLSSAMMKTPDLLRKIWSGIERSVEEFNNYGRIYDSSIVQEIINKNNTKLAEQFIKELNIK